VERGKGYFRPSELGFIVNDLLVDNFPDVFDVDFTARMEDLLDDIARGRESYESVLQELNRPLQASLHDARQKTEKLRQEMEEETGEKCPKCASPMVIKWGRFGKFMACSAFPKCKFSRPVEAPEEEVFSGRSCPRCGGRLLVKKGRYGRYLGCEKNPECRHTQPLPTGVRCPVEGCDGELVEKRTRKGRVFYGCSSYPECQYAVWNYPLGRNCPRCGFPVLVKKKKGIWCPSCKKKISD